MHLNLQKREATAYPNHLDALKRTDLNAKGLAGGANPLPPDHIHRHISSRL